MHFYPLFFLKDIFQSLTRVKAWSLAVLLFGIFSVLSADSSRPNIVLITYEDVSPHFGCYGEPQARTPAVDRLAEEGVLFHNLHGVSSVCAPNRSALAAGVHPNTLGTQNMRSHVKQLAGVLPFPKLLNEAGYFTVNQGKMDYNFPSPDGEWDDRGKEAHWRNREDPDQPFYAFYNMTSTHQGSVQRAKGYARSGDKLPDDEKADRSLVRVPDYLPDTDTTRELMARTIDNISYTDPQIAKIYSELEEDGLLENTWIFFLSDHGDGGYPRAKTYLYDSGLRSAFVVRPPSGSSGEGYDEAGMETAELVSFVDIPKTILSLADADLPDYMQGRVLFGDEREEPPAAVTAARDRINNRYDLTRAARTEQYKYIRNYQPWKPLYQEIPGFEQSEGMATLRGQHGKGLLSTEAAQFMAPTRPVEELYDITIDPDEVNNLASDPAYAEVLAEMRGHLRERYETIGDLGFIPEGMLERMGRAANGPRNLLDEDSDYDTLEAERWASFDHFKQTSDEVLVEALASQNPLQQYYACIAIGNREELPWGVKAGDLASLLESPYGDLSSAAAWALIQCGLDENAAEEALARVVQKGSWQERLNALNLIDYLGDKAEPLLYLSQDFYRDWKKKGRGGRFLFNERYNLEQSKVMLEKRDLPLP